MAPLMALFPVLQDPASIRVNGCTEIVDTATVNKGKRAHYSGGHV
jgi:hypothetical protein